MNKNIMLLARLYDAAAHDLQKALATQTVLLNDQRIKDQVIHGKLVFTSRSNQKA